MSGTSEGGHKTRDIIVKKHGANFYKKIGAQGGATGRGPSYKGGFASPNTNEATGLTGKERAQKFGAIGGKISKPYSRRGIQA